MRIAPHRILRIILLIAALGCAGYPLAHQAAQTTQTPPSRAPRIKATPTPTPTPTTGRRRSNSNQSNSNQSNPNSDQTQPTPTPSPTPRSGGHTGRNIAIGAGVGGGVLAAILATHGGGDKLSKNGPHFEDEFNMSDFKVTGYARGGWPVVVAYELRQTAIVTLSVTADKVAPYTERLDGTPGAHELIVHLPARFADKPHAAVYAVTATDDDPNAPRPVPIQLLGIGAGYNAVGSVGIDQVNFEPGRVNASQAKQQAAYSFHSLFDFNKVNVQFMRIKRGADGEIVAERVTDVDFDGISRGAERRGQWNCRKGKKVSQGLHQLQVRAWRGLRDGGDWVAAISPQSVLID